MNHCRNIAQVIAANLNKPNEAFDLYLTATNANTEP